MITIAASDVPVASRSPNPSHSTSSGTITIPPPTPNSPLKSPAQRADRRESGKTFGATACAAY